MIKRQVETLQEYMRKMKDFGVEKYRVIGTEALRRAENSQEVLKEIEAVTHIPTDVLSHEEEAQIYFHVVASDLDADVAVADTGGGSVQLCIGRKENLESMYLLKTGIYYMQERFGNPIILLCLISRKHGRCERRDREIETDKKNPGMKFVYGSTSIIDFVQALGIKLERVNYTKNHPYTVSIKELMKLYDKLMPYSYEERMAFYPAEPYFMWGADKGIMNIVSMCEALGIEEVIPSNMNISDGLLLELVKNL